MALTIRQIQTYRQERRRIIALTATDYSWARILDQSGVDLILVGDSLAMVALGHSTTLPVGVEAMLYHTQAVVRGVTRALVIADLPFGSYESSPEQAFTTAVPFLQAGAKGIKLEGGSEAMAQAVAFLVGRGIPVLGHLGLTPQAVHQLGGYRQQARTPESADELLSQALRLQAAGAFGLVLEHIPALVAKEVTAKLTIPTIGIGAGPDTSGQILVTHDLLGLSEFCPPFVEPVLDLKNVIQKAIQDYGQKIRGEG